MQLFIFVEALLQLLFLVTVLNIHPEKRKERKKETYWREILRNAIS